MSTIDARRPYGTVAGCALLPPVSTWSSAAAVASVLLAMMPTAAASKDTGVRASQASYLNNLRYTLADKGEPSASSICT